MGYSPQIVWRDSSAIIRDRLRGLQRQVSQTYVIVVTSSGTVTRDDARLAPWRPTFAYPGNL